MISQAYGQVFGYHAYQIFIFIFLRIKFMKKLRILMINALMGCTFFLASSAVGASDNGSNIITDRYGKTIGSYETNSDGTTVYKDSLGREITTSQQDKDGTLIFSTPDGDGEKIVLVSSDKTASQEINSVYRNRYGNRVATSKTDANGHTVIRNRYGQRVGTSDTDKNGKTTYRDRYGRKVATATENANGQTVIRDKYGKKIGTSTTDSNGKTTYRDRYGRKIGQAESK